MYTGEGPFQCGQCDKAFTLSCDLMKHLITHATPSEVCVGKNTLQTMGSDYVITHAPPIQKILEADSPTSNCEIIALHLNSGKKVKQSRNYLKRSWVWKYFKYVTKADGTEDMTLVACTETDCGYTIRYQSTTSNMVSHLKRKHLINHTKRTSNSISTDSDDGCTNSPSMQASPDPLRSVETFPNIIKKKVKKVYDQKKYYKYFHCSYCEKVIIGKQNFESHLTIHTGEKSFQCNECGNCFSRMDTLIIHQRTHTGEKPYQCSHCNKFFAQHVHLRKHLRTHTGEKSYTCNNCGKCFSRADVLALHQKVHTGDKPHKCSHCSKCFVRKDHMLNHQKTHTKTITKDSENYQRMFTGEKIFNVVFESNTSTELCKTRYLENSQSVLTGEKMSNVGFETNTPAEYSIARNLHHNQNTLTGQAMFNVGVEKNTPPKTSILPGFYLN